MQIEIDTVDLQNTLEQLYDRKVKLVAYVSADGLDTLVLEGNEEDLFNFYLESFNPFNEWTNTDVVRSEFFAHILTKQIR